MAQALGGWLMVETRKITVEHELIKCGVGPDNCGSDIILFRAPVVRDGSGTYKRLPHQVDWRHLQEGDAVIGEGPSGQQVLHVLQFWQVVLKEDDNVFTVEINNIVGMAGYGDYVYNQIAALVGLPPDSA
jgi:hypothetical protein